MSLFIACSVLILTCGAAAFAGSPLPNFHCRARGSRVRWGGLPGGAGIVAGGSECSRCFVRCLGLLFRVSPVPRPLGYPRLPLTALPLPCVFPFPPARPGPLSLSIRLSGPRVAAGGCSGLLRILWGLSVLVPFLLAQARPPSGRVRGLSAAVLFFCFGLPPSLTPRVTLGCLSLPCLCRAFPFPVGRPSPFAQVRPRPFKLLEWAAALKCAASVVEPVGELVECLAL